MGETFYPCELPEEAVSALSEAISACTKHPNIFVGGIAGDNDDRDGDDGDAAAGGDTSGRRLLSREALEGLVSSACEAGPVEGEGVLAVREAAVAVKDCFGEALKEERKQVRHCSRAVELLYGGCRALVSKCIENVCT